MFARRVAVANLPYVEGQLGFGGSKPFIVTTHSTAPRCVVVSCAKVATSFSGRR